MSLEISDDACRMLLTTLCALIERKFLKKHAFYQTTCIVEIITKAVFQTCGFQYLYITDNFSNVYKHYGNRRRLLRQFSVEDIKKIHLRNVNAWIQ